MKKLSLCLLAFAASSAFAANGYPDVQPNEVCWYQHHYLKGDRYCYSYPNEASTTWVGNNNNDKWSSVEVGKNITVQAYEHGYFGGAQWNFSETTLNFSNIANDAISSFKITQKSQPIGFITPQGNTIPNFNPSTQGITRIEAVMAGGWIGGDYTADIHNFGTNGRFNAYIYSHPYTKVVEFQVVGNQIKTLKAKYRYGTYNNNVNDYVTVDIATSESGNGYGVKQPKFSFGAITTDIKSWLPTENDLNLKMNGVHIMPNVFQAHKTASLTTTNGYWLPTLNFFKNTTTIPTNSTIIFRSNSSYSVSFENRFTLEQATDYEIIYNGNNWDLRKIFGDTFISSDGLNLPESEALAVKTVTAVIAGGWVQGQPSADIDSFGNGLYNAYVHSSGGIVKVVGFKIENGKIKITGAKYRTGDYVREASDYITAPIASSANASGYGLTYVAARLQGK